MNHVIRYLAVALCLLLEHTVSAQSNGDVVRGCKGTYGRPHRTADGRADLQKLLRELEDIGADTFHWMIWTHTNDWNVVKTFLPLAREKNIKVWITVVPPSESPPKAKMYAEPFRLDYERWASEIAKLSLEHTNLIAWSIDDFTHNLKFYTPDYLQKMKDASRNINPRLAFVPCCYFKSITPGFAKNYKPFLDGVLFPYRDESGGSNLKNADHVESEIKAVRKLLGPDAAVIIDVYASAHSRLGASTPEYVEKVIAAGLRAADGVMIYTHQDPKRNAEKYEIIKRLFRQQ